MGQFQSSQMLNLGKPRQVALPLFDGHNYPGLIRQPGLGCLDRILRCLLHASIIPPSHQIAPTPRKFQTAPLPEITGYCFGNSCVDIISRTLVIAELQNYRTSSVNCRLYSCAPPSANFVFGTWSPISSFTSTIAARPLPVYTSRCLAT